ncbi:MAG: hypothetical protein SVM80_07545 [Halobacteriota archaeon]|nr:hypothetical protein [Halobacteriota archaeon]
MIQVKGRMDVTIKGILKSWMKLGRIIGHYNTKFLLSLMFYTVITLYGSVGRLLKKDFLDLKLQDDVDTYWKGIEVKEEEYYKQY